MQIDQAESNQFVERMITLLNHSAIGLMMSVGYRTRLFDVMETLEPSSSQQIADAAGLQERYVREWLGVMVTGDIVHYDPENGTYSLPAEHAAWLTRKNSPNNLAVTTQWLPLMAQVEDRIVESFYKGGGLNYEEMGRFNEVMADESQQTVVTPLLDSLLPLMPGIQEKLEKGIRVLDVGCGSGRAMLFLAEEYPQSEFTGYDLLPEPIEHANDQAAKRGLKNARFEAKDAADIRETDAYDLIFTFDAVHDQANPDKVLKNIYIALKQDGIYFCQDIAGTSHVHKDKELPLSPFIYTISCTGCMSVSLGQGGAGLGAMWGRELAEKMMKAAGFTSVEMKQLEHDIINYYYIVKK